MAVADAVKARKVGAGLGRRDDVVDGHRVFGVGQRDIDDFGPGIRALPDCRLDDFRDLRRGAGNEVFPRQADAEPLQGCAAHGGCEVGHRIQGRGAVVRVRAEKRLREKGGVLWSRDDAKAVTP